MRKEYIPYEKSVSVSVTEKRAATDQSISLLNEFQKKAMENLIYSVKTEANNIHVMVGYFRSDEVSNKVTVVMQFSVNGFEHRISEEIDKFEWDHKLKDTYYRFGNEQAYNLFVKEASNIIAKAFVKECFKNGMP